MKGFSDWLDEAVGAKLSIKLSRKDAEAVLGLSGTWSKDDLKKAVRLAKSKAHPDKGGSTEEFNKVQAAEKTLSGSTGAGNSRVDWDEIHRQYQELYQQVMAELKGMVKPDNFVKYFQDLFGEKFHVNMEEAGATRGRSSPSYAGLHFEFANSGRTKVFEFDVHVSLHDVRYEKTKSIGGTADTLAYSVGITAYGYTNKRKVKMSQRDYTRSNSRKVLQDPKVAFPKSKLTKDQKKRKFSKRDMELFLKKELKAELGKYIYIPTATENMYIWMDRGTMMRTPYWQVSIWKKTGIAYSSAVRMYASFPETEDTAEMIKQASKMSATQAEKFLQNEYEKLKKSRS